MAALLDQSRGNYIYLLSYLLTHHFICERHWEEFGIQDELAYDFMRLKWDCRRRLSYFDINIISLGDNCLPANILTRWGLLPTLHQAEYTRLPYRGKLPFDKAVHSIRTICQMLRSGFEKYYPDGTRIIEGIKRFTITRDGLYACFLHDPYNSSLSERENFFKFNNVLEQRANLFIKKIRNKRTLCVLNASQLDIVHVTDLYHICREQYDSDLIVLSPNAYETSVAVPFFQYHDPRVGYRHFDVRDWYKDEGFDFEYKIVNFVMSYIESRFEKKSPSPMEMYPLGNCYIHVAKAHAEQGNLKTARVLLERALEENQCFSANLWLSAYSRLSQG